MRSGSWMENRTGKIRTTVIPGTFFVPTVAVSMPESLALRLRTGVHDARCAAVPRVMERSLPVQ